MGIDGDNPGFLCGGCACATEKFGGTSVTLTWSLDRTLIYSYDIGSYDIFYRNRKAEVKFKFLDNSDGI